MTHKIGKGAIVALLTAGSLTLGATSSMSSPAIFKAESLPQKLWDPGTRHVEKGKKVVWKNPTFEDHNIRAYGGNWSLKTRTIKPGETTSKRFKKRGIFRFRCTLHSFKEDGVWTGMVGKVRVHR